MNRIIRRPASNRDLLAIYRHYAREAGGRIADRFFAQAEAAFVRLAKMPGMGTRYNPAEPLYADLRYFPISRFPNYIVFHRPLVDGIEVLRVLHGSRDISGLLAADFSSDTDAEDDDR